MRGASIGSCCFDSIRVTPTSAPASGKLFLFIEEKIGKEEAT